MRKVSYKRRERGRLDLFDIRILEWERDPDANEQDYRDHDDTDLFLGDQVLMAVNNDTDEAFQDPDGYWTFPHDRVVEIAHALAAYNRRKNIQPVTGDSGILY